MWGAAQSRKQLPAPATVVFECLAHPAQVVDRPWLTLAGGERSPEVLHAAPDRFVLWSSLWADLPEVQVQLDLDPDPQDRMSTQLCWTSPSRPHR